MIWYKVLLAVAIAYLIGSFQTSYILGRLVKKVDIRNYGSGNPGATNAIRVFGLKFGLFVLLIDTLKGAFAVLLIRYMFHTSDVSLQLLSGIFCIIGHNHPFYMGFKGGKGVAASLGIILVIDWRVFLLAGVPALIILLLTRIMSLASLTFEFVSLIAFFSLYIMKPDFSQIVITAALYPLISFYRHRKNIVNLIEGNESPLWGKGKTDVSADNDNPDNDTED